jgi:hypothetical protein
MVMSIRIVYIKEAREYEAEYLAEQEEEENEDIQET